MKFDYESALTLRPEDLGTHPSGWTIEGEIQEDWFEWVNEFKASHPTFGKVWGDFETEVHADSEEGLAHFREHHAPEAWDYGDI